MKKKYLRWGLVIGWMIIIFIFSNQPAPVSDEKSKFIIRLFSTLGLNLNSILGDLANFVVRKCAHFTEYLILFTFLFNAFKEEYSFKKSLGLSVITVFLYACTDEFHQTFILGREGRFRDVLIDTSGSLFGVMSIIIYSKIKELYKKSL